MIGRTNACLNGGGTGLTYLYKDGNEFVEITGGWVVGYSDREGQQSKNGVLELRTNQYNAVRTYITDKPIDVSKMNHLAFDWENKGSAYPQVRFSLKENKNDDNNTFVANVSISDVWERHIKLLDVSALSGSYYVACQTRSTGSGSTILKVYRIWGV